MVFTRLDDTPDSCAVTWDKITLCGISTPGDKKQLRCDRVKDHRRGPRAKTDPLDYRRAGYLSSHNKPVVVGFGDVSASAAITAEIRWPIGTIQHLSNLKLNRYHKIVDLAQMKCAGKDANSI